MCVCACARSLRWLRTIISQTAFYTRSLNHQFKFIVIFRGAPTIFRWIVVWWKYEAKPSTQNVQHQLDYGSDRHSERAREYHETIAWCFRPFRFQFLVVVFFFYCWCFCCRHHQLLVVCCLFSHYWNARWRQLFARFGSHYVTFIYSTKSMSARDKNQILYYYFYNFSLKTWSSIGLYMYEYK